MKLTKVTNIAQVEGELKPVFQSISVVFREMNQAVNGNLTLGDNIIGLFQEQTIHTAATYSTGAFNPLIIPWSFTQKSPQSVIVAQVQQGSNQTRLLTPVTCVEWSFDPIKRTINIPYVTGLANSRKYTITFEAK